MIFVEEVIMKIISVKKYIDSDSFLYNNLMIFVTK